jgi:hypothetical protein
MSQPIDLVHEFLDPLQLERLSPPLASIGRA